MLWKKLGLVYAANGGQEWAASHAYVPTTLMMDEDRIRVYVAFLDSNKVGRVGFVDLDASNPLRVQRVSEQPVLDIGIPGTFDENGVTPTSIIRVGGKLYLYYLGWQLGVKVPYFLLAGLAISEDEGENFTRYSLTPILERSTNELFIRSAASVMLDDNRWRMWYASGSRWISVDGKQVPTYNMRYLESPDGKTWGAEGAVSLDLANNDEYGFGRPYVLKDDSIYKAWYSIRTKSHGYCLGYAESADGLLWTRKDNEAGLSVSSSGWDSQMANFACVQKTRYGTYMFYNGNNYGATGFGVAISQN